MAHYKHCEVDGCDQKFYAARPTTIEAHYEGWYQQKNGTVWCPNHRPEWAPKLKEK